MSATSEIGPVFFDRYWRCVADTLGLNPKHKSAAIELSQRPHNLSGSDLVRTLRESLEGAWWRKPVSTTAGNWVWRDTIPKHLTESPEVALERAIMVTAPREEWTCQMSTSSGLRGPRTDKRRAIDLVHQLDPETVQFIELKVASDNPVYAAFEVLGYGLAYGLARRHAAEGATKPKVMAASRVELLVLAPHSWYEYRVRGGGPAHSFELQWLEDQINVGLAADIQTQGLAGLNAVTFSFREFTYTGDPASDAIEIVRVTREHRPSVWG